MPSNAYEEAKKSYIPPSVNLLFVAEAPPNCLDRYFYFPDVKEHDYLWIALMKAIYQCEFGEVKQERKRKRYWVTRFSGDSNLLIDTLKEPIRKSPNVKSSVRSLLFEQRDRLILECKEISPRQIVLIKVTVYDALYKPLKAAGLPVIDVRLPFPGSGRQKEFHTKFRNQVTEGKIAPVYTPD